MQTRRDFLKLSSFSVAMLASGMLPLMAANNKTAKRPYAITDYHSYVSEFSPVAGNNISKVKELTYDYLLWKGYDKQLDVTGAIKSGSLKINHLSKTNVLSEFNSFTTNNRSKKDIPLTRMLADYAFDGDLGRGLKRWDISGETFSRNKEMSAFGAIKESGKISNGVMTTQSGNNKAITQAITGPLIPEWLLPLIIPMLSNDGVFECSMLRDGMFYLPRQSIVHCGKIDIAVKGGRNMTLDNWLHTGTGVLPTNYLVDENGLTQLITYGMVALALQSAR